MKKRLFILIFAVIMCFLVALPALAGEKAGVYQGKFESFQAEDVFRVLDEGLQKFIITVVDENDDNLMENTAVLTSPAKWTQGWLIKNNETEQLEGSWLKGMITWKTYNGVERYYFEVRIIDGKQQLVKSHLMSEHNKSVVNFVPLD